jgi:hypothetical protein
MFTAVQESLQIGAFSFYGCRVCSSVFRRFVVKLSSIVGRLAPHGLSDSDDHNTQATSSIREGYATTPLLAQKSLIPRPDRGGCPCRIVDMDFYEEAHSINCLKSPGRAHSVALWTAKEGLSLQY